MSWIQQGWKWDILVFHLQVGFFNVVKQLISFVGEFCCHCFLLLHRIITIVLGLVIIAILVFGQVSLLKPASIQ